MKWLVGLASIAGIYAVIVGLFYWFQEQFIFFPEKLPPEYRFSFPIPFEERTLKPDPETTIHFLHFKAANPRGVILYFHGNAGSLRTWGTVAETFVRRGYDVVLPDYRGYGKSRGALSENALLEDALRVYDTLSDSLPVVVYGRSLGSAFASYVASLRTPTKLILESPLVNTADLARRHYPWLPAWIVRYSLTTDRYLQSVRCPIVLFHGTSDEVIDFESSVILQNLSSATLFAVPGGHHNDLDEFPEYHTRLAEVLP